MRTILEGLRQGQDRPRAIHRQRQLLLQPSGAGRLASSLAALGKLKSVTRTSESLRGGMIHRSYRAEFEKKTVPLNIYVMPDGKYEQFMVE